MTRPSHSRLRSTTRANTRAGQPLATDERSLRMSRHDHAIAAGGQTTDPDFRWERSSPINVRPFGGRRVAEASSIPLSECAASVDRAPPRRPSASAPDCAGRRRVSKTSDVHERRTSSTDCYGVLGELGLRGEGAADRRRGLVGYGVFHVEHTPLEDMARRGVHCSPTCRGRSAGAQETLSSGRE